jgi:hypothetical protein
MRDFKSLVIGGIPVKYRSKIWAECSGATELSRPGYFEELCSLGTNGLDKISVQQIEMVYSEYVLKTGYSSNDA